MIPLFPGRRKVIFLLSFLGLYGILLSSCTKNAPKVNTPGPPIQGSVDKTDTLRVMAYNILNFGNLCQGSTTVLDGYFNRIIQYAHPDLVSCEKMTAFDYSPGAAGNLADDLVQHAFNVQDSGKYAYAAPTNASGSGTLSVIFYNTRKLGYLSTVDLLSLVTDFDLYKFYYKDVNLALTRDTTFLYAVVFHTKSGSASLERDFQDSTVMSALRTRFSYFPNLVLMGDFNTTGSYEKGYQSIITSIDSNTAMSNPPYYPDETLHYPGNWSVSPSYVAPYVTTSTRSLPYSPNSCGSSGGGKGWYDHIFISNWLIHGDNYIRYIPNSYQTIGNDGMRIGQSINSTLPSVNNSAPAEVLNDLYYFSDKYPVMVQLEVKANRNAYSLPDP
ncbi:MAG: hypothetical protein KGM98_09910 [Bacteroidota bacterium]|nr:hypothetical protein [Bacteroidota bacterium]